MFENIRYRGDLFLVTPFELLKIFFKEIYINERRQNI